VQLVIQNLSKTYPNGVAALRGVSLAIAPGLFGLLGPNGAGKSTLMRILATLQEADAGSARLGGIDVLRDREAVRRTLGYLPQEFGLYPKVSAEEMLDHFALLKGITRKGERRDVVHALLQQTNLWNARHRRLGSFSGGMRQRFGIAVALIGNPRLIIVDEPTAGLDPAERVRFLNLLSELGENAVVILSTHIVEDVSDLCTRMAVIESGRILLEAVPAEAVAAVRGRVWRRQVERGELRRFEQTLPVISTTLAAGRTVIHVHGFAPPDETFEPVEPDLKDVYFTVIRGIRVDAAPSEAGEEVREYGVREYVSGDGGGDGTGAAASGDGDAAAFAACPEASLTIDGDPTLHRPGERLTDSIDAPTDAAPAAGLPSIGPEPRTAPADASPEAPFVASPEARSVVPAEAPSSPSSETRFVVPSFPSPEMPLIESTEGRAEPHSGEMRVGEMRVERRAGPDEAAE
jgi:ABC-2 type transport system ATP-binding protein